MAKKFDRTKTVGEVGEHGVLAILEPYLAASGTPDVQIGVGDDCALVCVGRTAENVAVLTTDMLVEGTHFLTRPPVAWELIGRKAMTANISDVAAMGGCPRFALISLGLPPDFPISSLLEFYEGMHGVAQEHQVKLVGGDTVASPVVAVSIAILGSRSASIPGALRSACRPGQHVFVTGELGASKAGLELLLDETLRTQLPNDIADCLIARHMNPTARVAAGQALAERFGDLGMIDISDSLWNELHLLAQASRVGFTVKADDIPVASGVREYCRRLGHDPLDYALFSGEEYELLFTVQATVEEVRAALKGVKAELPVHCIGEVVSDARKVVVMDSTGRTKSVRDATFRHFPS